jgi:hypothetical protein
LKERGNGHFHGHLTVGQFKDAKTAKAMISNWSKTWKPLIWDVDTACFIARRGETPFRVKERLHLRKVGEMGQTVTATHQICLNDSSAHKASGFGSELDNFQLFDDPEESVPPERYESNPVPETEPHEHTSRAPKRSRIPTVAWPDGEVGNAVTRIDTWLSDMALQHRDKLPKSRSKLLAAIKKLCIVRQKPLTGQQMCTKFVAENLISIQNESVEYLQKDNEAKPLPKIEDNPHGWRMTSEEKVLTRCRAWIRNPANGSFLHQPTASVTFLRHGLTPKLQSRSRESLWKDLLINLPS